MSPDNPPQTNSLCMQIFVTKMRPSVDQLNVCKLKPYIGDIGGERVYKPDIVRYRRGSVFITEESVRVKSLKCLCVTIVEKASLVETI